MPGFQARHAEEVACQPPEAGGVAGDAGLDRVPFGARWLLAQQCLSGGKRKMGKVDATDLSDIWLLRIG